MFTAFLNSPDRNLGEVCYTDCYTTATEWHKKRQGKGFIPVLPVHKPVNVPSATMKKFKKVMKPSDGLKTGTNIEKPTLNGDI